MAAPFAAKNTAYHAQPMKEQTSTPIKEAKNAIKNAAPVERRIGFVSASPFPFLRRIQRRVKKALKKAIAAADGIKPTIKPPVGEKSCADEENCENTGKPHAPTST